jgi:hypothetical protein
LGGEPGCFIIEKHLSRFVEGTCSFVSSFESALGQDPRNLELIWDQVRLLVIFLFFTLSNRCGEPHSTMEERYAFETLLLLIS